jgi:hypothetical protein
MIYKGIVKRGLIELEGEVILPEGTRVSIIPDEPVAIDIHMSAITLNGCGRHGSFARSSPKPATQ